jgi:hypothetical protein
VRCLIGPAGGHGRRLVSRSWTTLDHAHLVGGVSSPEAFDRLLCPLPVEITPAPLGAETHGPVAATGVILPGAIWLIRCCILAADTSPIAEPPIATVPGLLSNQGRRINTTSGGSAGRGHYSGVGDTQSVQHKRMSFRSFPGDSRLVHPRSAFDAVAQQSRLFPTGTYAMRLTVRSSRLGGTM